MNFMEWLFFLTGGATAADPELILFDEPTSALDPELIGKFYKKCIFLTMPIENLFTVSIHVETEWRF